MSVKSFLSKLLVDVDKVAPLVQFAANFTPFGALVSTSLGILHDVELRIPQDNAGPEKLQESVDSFENYIQFTRKMAEQNGQEISYDVEIYKKAMSAQVTALNLFGDFQKTFVIKKKGT